MKRVWALATFFWRELFRSVTGILVLVGALVFYLVAILSITGGVDRSYFALVIGGFFGIYCLVLTLIVADRAHHASSYLFLSRLPSRITFLAAVTLTGFLVAGLLELGVALLSLPRLSSGLSAEMVVDVVPVWISWLGLGAVLGLHMSELVRRGWSRILIYAFLAFILFSLNQQQSGVPVGLADRFGWIPSLTPDPANWGWAIKLVQVITWPVAAGVQVARSTPYGLGESLAPGVTLLVAALLLGLAVRLFDAKDLILPES